MTVETQETPPQEDRPQQFRQIEDRLHAERERVREMAQDWSHVPPPDIRDMRDAQLLGETLLSVAKAMRPVARRGSTVRMQPSLGFCQDVLELRA